MSQNTSSAVMQQRSEPHDSLDDFPTQPWATRALMKYVIKRYVPDARLDVRTCWEPACNRGYMARPLKEYFRSVYCSDVHNYGWKGQDAVDDFLFHGAGPGLEGVDWIITNPPFRLAEQFIAKARIYARQGCAMIVRSAFMEGVGRYERLFSAHPPAIVAQVSERVPMVKGRCDPEASTATAYCWLVFLPGDTIGTHYVWIPPCRKELERADDYEWEAS